MLPLSLNRERRDNEGKRVRGKEGSTSEGYREMEENRMNWELKDSREEKRGVIMEARRGEKREEKKEGLVIGDWVNGE